MKRTERFRCRTFGTEQIRCRVLMREQIRCLFSRESKIDVGINFHLNNLSVIIIAAGFVVKNNCYERQRSLQ